MDENQKKLIADQMRKIPQEVREAIENSDWERVIFNIGREHKLHIDDIDILSIEAILTMIGLEHPKDFSVNLKKRIGISEDSLGAIIDDVNAKLFSKIREALRIHYEKVSAGEIMADEEKDELHHAGVDIEDGYEPTAKKKAVATLIDQRIKNPEVTKVVQSVSTPSPDISKEKPAVKIPEITFDPYREPIE